MLRRPNARTAERTKPRWGAIGIALLLIVIGVAGTYAWTGVSMLQARDANTWRETRCTITQSEIVQTLDDGNTVHDITLRYTYQVDGKPHVGKRLDFVDDTRAESHDVLAARHPPAGAVVPCWYDPAEPRRSVLVRRGWSGLAALSPLSCVLFGIATLTSSRARARHETLRDGRYRITCRAARVATVWACAGIAWLTGALAISMVAEPRWSVLALGTAAAISTTVFLYYACAHLTKVTVTVAAAELRPGDAIAAQIAIRGPVRARSCGGQLVGRERSAWHDGSDAKFDLREFHRADLDGARIPSNAIPSVDRGTNTIEWLVRVVAEIPCWPDIALDIPLVVRGELCDVRRPDVPLAEVPADARIALVLDGDRRAFAPGEQITGTLGWKRDRAPSRATVRLAWTSASRRDVTHTERVGEIAVGELPRVVAPRPNDPYRGASPTEEAAPELAAAERRRLRFVAPDAPYTFEGAYFDVTWRLELAIEDVGEVDVERISIRIAPDAG